MKQVDDKYSIAWFKLADSVKRIAGMIFWFKTGSWHNRYTSISD